MLECFSIKDNKIEHFMTPFWTTGVVDALRSLSVAANNPDSNLNRFPDEYSLYSLCKMDETTGEVIYTKPELICLVSKMLKNIKK